MNTPASQTSIRTGWLKKKGEQRYFTLDIPGQTLKYSNTPENLLKGKYSYLDLKGSQIMTESDPPYTLRIEGPLLNPEKKGKAYVLTANVAEDYSIWLTALAEVTGKPVLVQPVTPPVHHLNVPTTISSPLPVGNGSGGISPRKATQLSAIKMEGYLSKHQRKSIIGMGSGGQLQRRYFILNGYEMSYSETPTSPSLGTLDLRGSSVACEGANSLTFTLTGPNLNGSKRGKAYKLTAETFEDMRAWTATIGKISTITNSALVEPLSPGVVSSGSSFTSLPDTISPGCKSPQQNSLNSSMTLSTTLSSVPTMPLALAALKMEGYLLKQSKPVSGRPQNQRRYFSLKGYELSYAETQSSVPLGTLDLRGSSVACEGANSLTFTLSGPNLNGSKKGKSYTLTAETFEDMRAWTAALGKVVQLLASGGNEGLGNWAGQSPSSSLTI